MTRLLSLLLCLAPGLGLAQDVPPPIAAPPVVDVSERLHILMGPPGCPGDGYTNINLVTTLFDHFARTTGSVSATSSGTSVLVRGAHFLFPEEGFGRPQIVRRLFEEASSARREVLDEALPVLVSPYELMFEFPRAGHSDWLSVVEAATGDREEYPDARRQTARLVRYTLADGARVLSLEFAGTSPEALGSPLDWVAEFGVGADVRTPDDSAHLFMIGRQLAAGPRTKAELDGIRASISEEPSLTVQLGAVETVLRPGGAAYCASALSALRVDAVVPTTADLAQGTETLRQLAERDGVPFVAANLHRKGESNTAFPRFRLFRFGQRSVAVIGIVDTDRLDSLPATVRAEWQAEDERLALQRTTDDLRRRPEGLPDFVVLLHSSAGHDLPAVASARWVDVVMGHVFRWDAFERQSVTEFPGSPRERTRSPQPVTAIETSEFDVTHLVAEFEGRTLARVRTHTRPVLPDGPTDSTLHHAFRELEERDLESDHRVVLPDPTDMVTESEELSALVWGERILHRRAFRRYAREWPARFSDPLWMRFVTNVLRAALSADVAISTNLRRTADIVGNIQLQVARAWLAPNDSVRLLEVSGAQLALVLARLKRQETPGTVEAEDYLMASGVNAASGRVGGRTLDPSERYLVATTDSVLAVPEIASALEGADVAATFARSNDRYRPTSSGDPLLLRDVVLQRLELWADENGEFNAAHIPEVAAALADKSEHIEGRWRLRIDELSGRASVYHNTDNVSVLGSSGEARVSTPNNYNLGVRGHLAFVYDGPKWIWDNRVRGGLDRVVFDDLPAQEQSDDLVASTELQLRGIRLGSDEAPMELLPFARALLDTEFTRDPSGETPRQLLGRGSLGFVLRPGPHLKEVRLGALAQYAFRDGRRYDLGVEAGYVLDLPIAGPLAWKSELALRYFVPDSRDTDADLGFVGTWVNRLAVGFTRDFALFVFADLYTARGKVPLTTEFAASVIVGGGLDFTRVLRL